MANKSNPLLWIGIGCFAAICCVFAFVAFIFVVVFGAMRSSAPYQDAVARAQNDPRVIEVLGKPVEPGWFVSGQIKTTGRSGVCNLDVPLRGSKQKGSVHIVGYREGGRWSYSRILMTPDRGEPIDLLAAP